VGGVKDAGFSDGDGSGDGYGYGFRGGRWNGN
jgi:hypothetical protein